MTNPTATLIHDDCIAAMRALPSNSVDSIVTDPPYGLGFMGKAWDDLPPGKEWAEECLRVLKPGGHLLAFGGSRTWHRLAVAVEDAGFEIRDSIMWLYGTGFPKSLDVSKAIDKRPGVQYHREFADEMRRRRLLLGYSTADVSAEVVGTRSGACWNWENHQFPEAKWWPKLKAYLHMDNKWDVVIAEVERNVTGTDTKARSTSGKSALPTVGGTTRYESWDLTAPATDAAKQWEGWGTALKPAHEPCVVARKPLEAKTVAGNVLEFGTGALNIDASRIGTEERTNPACGTKDGSAALGGHWRDDAKPTTATGRWPANVILDEHAADLLDEQSGFSKSSATPVTASLTALGLVNDDNWKPKDNVQSPGHGDSGGASRFFYVAKAPKAERPVIEHADGTRTAHPTVKPLTLMRHLVTLVTPPGGTVLEPFAGSGATVEACLLEGFSCIAIEREAEYLPLIEARIARVATIHEDSQPLAV